MKKKRIYFDLDGVLADYDSAKEDPNGLTVEEKLYLDAKDKHKIGVKIIGDDHYNQLERVLIKNGSKVITKAGFFSSLKPIEGALEAFIKLSKWYECYFLSTAPWSNPHAWSEKRLWVEEHLGEHAFKKLILTHNKDFLLGDFLIDDRTANGAAQFVGEHIHFGTEQFPNWESVYDYLIDPERIFEKYSTDELYDKLPAKFYSEKHLGIFNLEIKKVMTTTLISYNSGAEGIEELRCQTRYGFNSLRSAVVHTLFWLQESDYTF